MKPARKSVDSTDATQSSPGRDRVGYSNDAGVVRQASNSPFAFCSFSEARDSIDPSMSWQL